MKRCSQCKKEKPETDFHKDATASDGRRSACKICRNKSHRAYCLANKEKKAAYAKAYEKANRQDILARHKKWRLANKEKETARIKAWRLANKEKKTAYDKAYRLANKKKIVAYRKANGDKRNARNRKYEALKVGNNHEPYKDMEIFERDGWICGICGLKIDKRLKRPNLLSKSIDHIIPLSKGGADAPINLQAAHLICNIGKHTKPGGQLRLIG